MHSIQGNSVQIAEYRQQIETDVERQLKMETQIAVSLIQQFYDKQLAGELTETANELREMLSRFTVDAA